MDTSDEINSLAAEFDDGDNRKRSFKSHHLYKPTKKGPFLYEFQETEKQWRHALRLLNSLRRKMGRFRRLRWDERLAKEIKGEHFREKRAYHSVLKNPASLAKRNLRLGVKQTFMELTKYFQCDSSHCRGKPFVKNGEKYTMPYAFVDQHPSKIGCRGRLFKKKGETRLRITILCKTNTRTSESTELFRLKDVTNKVIRGSLTNFTKTGKKKKIELERTNIVKARVQAIVDSVGRDLLPGDNKGVNGAIHRAAGPKLAKYVKNRFKDGVKVGNAAMAPSFEIKESGKGRAESIIFAVPPRLQKYAAPTKIQKEHLASCYKKALNLAVKHKIKSIAFPPLGVGHHKFPKEEAAEVAVKTVTNWLKRDENAEAIDNIKFVVYKSDEEYKIYHALLNEYLPKYYAKKTSDNVDASVRDPDGDQSTSAEKRKVGSSEPQLNSDADSVEVDISSHTSNRKEKENNRIVKTTSSPESGDEEEASQQTAVDTAAETAEAADSVAASGDSSSDLG